jgi:hypothetical protein
MPPKTSVTATDLANQQAFYDNEHPIAEDLSNIPEQAYDYVAQLIWNALSDRNGVLSGLACTFAGGDAIVTVGDGSLIMQGNQAQHASANYTHTGADGTWYLYARPQTEADSTSTGDRSFVVSNQPVSFRKIEPATGETPDGSKKDFLLQHNRVIQSSFRGFVDGDSVGCTVSNSTGTGGYAEAHFTDAPGAGTTVTFYYDVETGGYGTVQAVDTQNKVSLEFDSNAAVPPRAGWVGLCQYTVVGGNVTAVDETITSSVAYKEFILDYNDTAIQASGPGGYKKVLDLLYYLERGDTLLERSPVRYGTGFDVEPTGGTTSFSASLVNGADEMVVSNQAEYDAIKAGNTFYVSDGAGGYEDIDGDGYPDPYRVQSKTDSAPGGSIQFGTNYLGATHVQAGNIAFVRLGSLADPVYESFIQNVETPLVKNGDGVEIRIDDDSDSGAQEFLVTHDDGTDPADVLLRVSEDGTVDVPTKLTVPTPNSATEAQQRDHYHDGGSGSPLMLRQLGQQIVGVFDLAVSAWDKIDYAAAAISGNIPNSIASIRTAIGNEITVSNGAGNSREIFGYTQIFAKKGTRYLRSSVLCGFNDSGTAGDHIDVVTRITTDAIPPVTVVGVEITFNSTAGGPGSGDQNAGWYDSGDIDLGAPLAVDTHFGVQIEVYLTCPNGSMLKYGGFKVYEYA